MPVSSRLRGAATARLASHSDSQRSRSASQSAPSSGNRSASSLVGIVPDVRDRFLGQRPAEPAPLDLGHVSHQAVQRELRRRDRAALALLRRRAPRTSTAGSSGGTRATPRAWPARPGRSRVRCVLGPVDLRPWSSLLAAALSPPAGDTLPRRCDRRGPARMRRSSCRGTPARSGGRGARRRRRPPPRVKNARTAARSGAVNTMWDSWNPSPVWRGAIQKSGRGGTP